VKFVNKDGDIIVPKPVRPIIEYEQTFLGNKKQAKKQFRHGNLHIREYYDYYAIHVDRIDPRKDPAGHLLIDAPEYLTGIIAAAYVGKIMNDLICRYKSGTSESKRPL
jgi:hypothetical protein